MRCLDVPGWQSWDCGTVGGAGVEVRFVTGGNIMSSDFVTIATFTTLPEAEAARMRIEAEGIPAVVTDAEIVNMDWLLGNAVGYIKLQVPPSNAPAATALLDQIAAERRERLEREEDDDTDDSTCLACGADLPEDADRCPACDWSWTDGRE